jgi:hypothetical protein
MSYFSDRLQASGVNFLPMEQRMTRDFDAWKQHRHVRHHPKADAPETLHDAFAKGCVEEMERGATVNGELDALHEVDAVHISKLVRSNSVAY